MLEENNEHKEQEEEQDNYKLADDRRCFRNLFILQFLLHNFWTRRVA